MEVVRIAAKPPVSTSKQNEWDESINWEPNSKKWEENLLGTGRKTQPPFVNIQVPYDV